MTPDQWLQIISIIVLIGTGVILGMTAYYLKQYVEQTAYQTKLQSRPYLSLLKRLEPAMTGGDKLNFYVRNHGLSVALNIEVEHTGLEGRIMVFKKINSLERESEIELKGEKIVNTNGETSGENYLDEFRKFMIVFSGEEDILFTIRFENLIQQKFVTTIKLHGEDFIVEEFVKK